MADLVNEFSWSISQGKELSDCQRSYFYRNYGSWEGWPSGKGNERAKTIYMLKSLKNKDMWVGSVIHDTIKSVLLGLRSGYAPDYSVVERILIQRMNDDAKSSREKMYQKNPKVCTGFFEDEYGTGLSQSDINDAMEFAIKCLQNFFNSDTLKFFQTLSKDKWLTIDESRPPMSFTFEGTKVWAKIDVAVKDGGRIKIYDWKTSRKLESDYSLQLACYLACAMRQWGAQAADIDLIEVNLAQGKETSYHGLSANIKSFEGYMREGISRARSFQQEGLAEEDFAQVNAMRHCKRCKYQRVCKPPVLEEGSFL